MDDYLGKYDKLINGLYSNQSDWMRENAIIDLIHVYDSMFRPKMNNIFPKVGGYTQNGSIASVDDPIYVAYSADPQTMSPWGDYLQRGTPRTIGFGSEELQARMMVENFPTYNPLEYANQFKRGFLDARNQILLSNAVRSMERRLEYTLTKVAFGDQSTLNMFGNQYSKTFTRFKKFNGGETDTSASTYLGGKAWDDTGSNPMDDIVKITSYMNEMAQVDPTIAYIGINTAAGLEKNSTIYDLVKYHYDATTKPIGSTVKGITFEKVMGQTYKSNALAGTRVGGPGQGNPYFDNWDTRRVEKMMVSTTGGTSYEWALFAGGRVGYTFNARCHPRHADVTTPYGHEWQDPRTEMMYSDMYYAIAPYVEDFGKLIVVEGIAAATL